MPGISGMRAPAESRWRSRRVVAARMKEEADERARHVSERGRGALGELSLVGGPGVA